MRSALKRAGIALAGALLATSVATTPAYAEPAALTGTITSEATGEAIAGCVTAYDTTYNWISQTCTDTGTWTLDGLEAGVEYKVEVSPYFGGHISKWAPDASSFDDAAVYLAPAVVDVALAEATTVAGHLSVADGDPVPAGTSVKLWPTGGGSQTYAYLEDNGDWVATVAVGSYLVEFETPNGSQWAVGKATREDADAIEATAGATTRVDDVLPAVEEATFSGSVTSAATGAAVAACVSAYSADYEWAGSSCTESGSWQIDELLAGVDYKFEATTYDNVHLGEWADDASDFESARTYTGPATIDFALEQGAVVTGSVLGADGRPSPRAWASLEPVEGDGSHFLWLEEDGSFTTLVPAGDYVMPVYDAEGMYWAASARTREDATTYHLVAGETTTINARSPQRAKVVGTVTSDVDGKPLAGICVTVRQYPLDPDTSYGWGDCTDATGRYEVRLEQPGTYIAEFSDDEDWDSEDPGPAGDWLTEYHPDVATAADAVPFQVGADSPATVDASLAPAATISGVALDAKLGTPLAGVCATAYAGSAGDYVDGQYRVCTQADGRWTVKGLRAGSYALNFTAGYVPGESSRTWAFKSTTQAGADLISVSDGERKTIRGVKMPTPVTISGRITDSNGNPVEGATVNPRGGLPDRSGECYNCAVTDADGRYTLPPLPAGSYRPVAYGSWEHSLAPMWSGGASSYEAATPITVKSGKSAEFSASLLPASQITGRLVSASGQALDGWIGEVVTLNGRHVADMDAYPADEFTVRSLPAGTFRLRFAHWETGQVVWLGGVDTPEESTSVTVGVGETKDIVFEIP